MSDPNRLPAQDTVQAPKIVGPGLVRWRCRPDGNHRWIRLDVTPADATRLRRRAREAGVNVDAWLGIALGVRASLARLDGAQLPQHVRSTITATPIKPGADRQLRSWQRYLSGQDAPGLADELPEVVITESTSGQCARAEVGASLDLGVAEWEVGRQCEIRAAGAGVPLPAYIRSLAAAE